MRNSKNLRTQVSLHLHVWQLVKFKFKNGIWKETGCQVTGRGHQKDLYSLTMCFYFTLKTSSFREDNVTDALVYNFMKRSLPHLTNNEQGS